MSVGRTPDQPRLWGLHSHNDQEQPNPFTDANALSYTRQEVDVFLVSGVLRVGHDLTSATSGPTLAAAYFDKIVALANASQPNFMCIDLKDSPSDTAFTALVTLLNSYANLADGHMPVTCTGNTPVSPSTHPSWVTFGRARSAAALADSTCSDIEVNFQSFSSWDGTAPTPLEVREQLVILADEAQNAGKRLRMYFMPATQLSWLEQYRAGCHFIQPGGNHPPGADDIAGLASYAVSQGWIF